MGREVVAFCFRREGACCRELSLEALRLALGLSPVPGSRPPGWRAHRRSAVTKMCNLDFSARPRTEKRWGWLISNRDLGRGSEQTTFSLLLRRAGERPGWPLQTPESWWVQERLFKGIKALQTPGFGGFWGSLLLKVLRTWQECT